MLSEAKEQLIAQQVDGAALICWTVFPAKRSTASMSSPRTYLRFAEMNETKSVMKRRGEESPNLARTIYTALPIHVHG